MGDPSAHPAEGRLMELGTNEQRVLSLNRKMVLAWARAEGTEEHWLDVFRRADEHLAAQAAMERQARPVDVGADFFRGQTDMLMRQRSHVPL